MADSKVNQLDSYLLDNLYESIISDQILKAFPFDSLKRVLVKILVKTAYLLRSLWKRNTSQGNEIYNLIYISPPTAYLALHYLLEVFHIIHSNYKEHLGLLAKAWNLGILGNWVLFLLTGKHRTLMERIGRVELRPKDPQKRLNIDYMYTQRALFFQIVTDALRGALPYLKIDSIVKFLNDEISLSRNEEDVCAVCGEEDVVSPVRFKNCQHMACYVCSRGIRDQRCPRCKS